MARGGGKPQPTITDDRALGAADIQRSLRFNRADSAHLTYTPASASSDRTKITISVWVKKCGINEGEYSIFHGGTTSNDRSQLRFYHSGGYDNLSFFARVSGTFILQCDTSAKFRDPSSWYHIVARCDTTNGTANIYVNGEDQDLSTSTKPSGSQSLTFFNNVEHQIGERGYDGSGTYINGYMAEMNVIQGQALDPSYFGFTDTQTGIWMPKRYEGTYGDGFYLDFLGNTSTTTLGIDKSPNGNDFTLNNFSVAAGEDNDSLLDTPSNNFCTMNPLMMNGTEIAGTHSDGNLTWKSDNNYATTQATFPVTTGKWYWECEMESQYVSIAGITRGTNAAENTFIGYDTNGNLFGFGYYYNDGTVKGTTDGLGTTSNNNLATSQTTAANGDILGIASDIANGYLIFYKNGTHIYTITGISNAFDWFPSFSAYGTSATWHVNYGQRPFTYTPPVGHKSLCSKNLLPDSKVVRPKKHFDTLLYTGNDSSDRNVEGLEFQPDFVWIKNRDQSDGHQLVDVVRGANKTLFTNSTTLESTDNSNGHVNYFTSGGFNVDAGAGGDVNENNEDYVAWCWKAGGAAVTNNDGSITTQVSANQEAGFSIMTYTGTGSAGTCGHGLGAVPHMIITKRRDGTDEWTIYHKDLDHSSSTNHRVIRFNASAQTGSSALYYGNDPTSTVQHQAAYGALNASSETYVAYCWTSIPGYSKFGKYTGNGNSKGSYIHLGFRPAFIMLSRYDSGNNWHIADSKRQNSFNPVTAQIYPNLTAVEAAQVDLDILSDGFKIRNSANFENASGGTYIYMAFAEQPSVTPFDTFPNAR